MRRIMILFFLLFQVFTFTAAIGQEFSIGPKIGVSQGNISVNGTSFSSGEEKLGYHAGLFARLGGRRIFIQPEVLYSNTGGEFNSTQSNNTVTYTAKFNKIETPIMAGLKFADFFRVQAGPTISFIIDSSISSSSSASVQPDYHRANIAYQAGIGLDIANMIVDLKYEGPLGKLADAYVGLPTDQRQNQLILSLGIRLF